VPIANALQLEATGVAPVILGCFWPVFYGACPLRTTAISQLPIRSKFSDSDIAMGFSDTDFLRESNLAIRRRFHA